MINHINESLLKANKEKSLGCKSDSDFGHLKIASESYKNLSDYLKEILESNALDSNLNLQLTITQEFCLFQANECLSGFLFRKQEFDNSLKAAEDANSHIENLLRIIDSRYNEANEVAKDYIDRGRVNWKLEALTIKVKLLEPIARKAVEEKDFVRALDYYKKTNDLNDGIFEFITNNEVDLVLKRTELGNYYSSKAGTANTLSAIYVLKSGYEDYWLEILEQFLYVLKYLKLALKNNPEQDKFKEGIEAVTDNTKILLTENKAKWFEYMVYFNNDRNLELIMRQTDNENYKMLNAKLEIEKDKPKHFILTFGFLISLFLILTYVLFQVAKSEIPGYRFLILIFALPLIFTVIGAFALRSTESLKEENFLKLMKLAFKINIKGLKIFSDKTQ
jgi:hypothetical protein